MRSKVTVLEVLDIQGLARALDSNDAKKKGTDGGSRLGVYQYCIDCLE